MKDKKLIYNLLRDTMGRERVLKNSSIPLIKFGGSNGQINQKN